MRVEYASLASKIHSQSDKVKEVSRCRYPDRSVTRQCPLFQTSCREVNQCQNGGTMIWDQAVKQFTCLCKDGYKGKLCEGNNTRFDCEVCINLSHAMRPKLCMEVTENTAVETSATKPKIWKRLLDDSFLRYY